MPNPLQRNLQQTAYLILGRQALGVFLIALLLLLFHSKLAAGSALLSGLMYVFLNILFVASVFRYYKAQEMVKFMTVFMAGEALKLIFSAIFFLMIVKYLKVSLLFTLIGLIGAIVSFWVAAFSYFVRN